jgi:hypothetical protein
MRTYSLKLLTMGAALGAAALLGACHDDHGGAATPPAASNAQDFSDFAKNTFALGPNTTPVNFDNVVLNYDVDTNPDAFDSLLM